jgi:hypothetical protein
VERLRQSSTVPFHPKYIKETETYFRRLAEEAAR